MKVIINYPSHQRSMLFRVVTRPFRKKIKSSHDSNLYQSCCRRQSFFTLIPIKIIAPLYFHGFLWAKNLYHKEFIYHKKWGKPKKETDSRTISNPTTKESIIQSLIQVGFVTQFVSSPWSVNQFNKKKKTD